MTTLGISGGFFTLNGTRTFLLGQSYFAVLNARISDLDDFQIRGYNLLRIFVDWVKDPDEYPTRDGGYSLLNANGSLKSAKTDLLDFIRAADRRGIVIELAILNGSSDGWMTTNTDRNAALTAVLTYFGDEPNVMFELINEVETCTSWITTFAALTSKFSTARSAHATALLFVDSCPATFDGDGPFMHDTTNVVDSSFMTSLMATGNQIVAPHFKGNAAWWYSNVTRIANLRAWMDANGHASKPIYLNENNRWDPGYGDTGAGDLEADYYLNNAWDAKRGGGAAYVHHSSASFHMTSPAAFRTRFAHAEEQDAYDRLPGFVYGDGASSIGFDSHADFTAATGTNQVTGNVVVANRKNRHVTIGTGARGNNAGNLVVSSVTVDGILCQKIVESISGDIGGEFAGTSLWSIVAPRVATLAVVITYTGTVSNILSGWGTVRYNVHQTRPVQSGSTATGSATSGSQDLRIILNAKEPDGLGVDSIYQGDDTGQTLGNIQTPRSNRVVTGGSTDGVGGSEQPAPAPGVIPMSWIPNSATFWASCGLVLNSDREGIQIDRASRPFLPKPVMR